MPKKRTGGASDRGGYVIQSSWSKTGASGNRGERATRSVAGAIIQGSRAAFGPPRQYKKKGKK